MRKIAKNYKLPYYTLSPTYSICKTHGYLSGELYTCPHCGEKTEVYSRITGYYRPVQNWNEGKSQEFKERKVYQVAMHPTPSEIAGAYREKLKSKKNNGLKTEQETVQVEKIMSVENTDSKERLLLFTTKTCPNCRIAEYALQNKHLCYEKIDAEGNQDLVEDYGIRQAPTLVVIHGDTYEKYANATAINQFIAED